MIWLMCAAMAQETVNADESVEGPPTAVEPVPVEPVVVEPASPPRQTVFELPAPPILPSALNSRPSNLPDDPEALAELLAMSGLSLEDLEQPRIVRGSWFFRPHIQVAQLLNAENPGPVAMRTGLTLGRRYATIQALPIQLVSELALTATAPLGGGIGRRVSFNGNVGPWLGPVRIQAGLHVRWEKEQWRRRTLVLDDAILLGPDVTVALDTGLLTLNVGVLPLFTVRGERGPLYQKTLPTLGDETVWSAGLGVDFDSIGLHLQGSLRDTAIGTLLEFGPTLSFYPGGN